MAFFRKKKKVTLVLGGGSARGLAHIGVLKVLQREMIPIDMIVGTSIGALIGASYAAGVTLKMMEETAYQFTLSKLLDPVVPTIGLLAGDKLEGAIRQLIDNKRFEDCRIPLAVVATDIEKGEEVIYQKGELVDIVRASCSWPGIFSPVRVDGRLLVDGGIKNSVPTRIAKALGADYILAVDVGFCVRCGQRIENIFQILLQSFQITGEELNRYQSDSADAVIKVDLGLIDQAAFNRSKEIVQKGIEAAESKIIEIKKSLGLGG